MCVCLIKYKRNQNKFLFSRTLRYDDDTHGAVAANNIPQKWCLLFCDSTFQMLENKKKRLRIQTQILSRWLKLPCIYICDSRQKLSIRCFFLFFFASCCFIHSILVIPSITACTCRAVENRARSDFYFTTLHSHTHTQWYLVTIGTVSPHRNVIMQHLLYSIVFSIWFSFCMLKKASAKRIKFAGKTMESKKKTTTSKSRKMMAVPKKK